MTNEFVWVIVHGSSLNIYSRHVDITHLVEQTYKQINVQLVVDQADIKIWNVEMLGMKSKIYASLMEVLTG